MLLALWQANIKDHAATMTRISTIHAYMVELRLKNNVVVKNDFTGKF